MIVQAMLVKNGIPWDVADEMDDDFREAFFVLFGQMSGGKFNWRTREWEAQT